MKVLIVEDAPFLSEMVRDVLSREGYEVVGVAGDGLEAVELARQFAPDLILMDLVLPLLSGVEATKKILEHNPGTKIVAVSTLDDEAIVQQALEAGCSNFIAKPFKKKDLLSLLGGEGEYL